MVRSITRRCASNQGSRGYDGFLHPTNHRFVAATCADQVIRNQNNSSTLRMTLAFDPR
jgi:hypothetical protein